MLRICTITSIVALVALAAAGGDTAVEPEHVVAPAQPAAADRTETDFKMLLAVIEEMNHGIATTPPPMWIAAIYRACRNVTAWPTRAHLLGVWLYSVDRTIKQTTARYGPKYPATASVWIAQVILLAGILVVAMRIVWAAASILECLARVACAVMLKGGEVVLFVGCTAVFFFVVAQVLYSLDMA